MTFGVDVKDERSDSSKGSVLELASFLLDIVGVGAGGGGFFRVTTVGSTSDASESELLDENVRRLRLGTDDGDESIW